MARKTAKRVGNASSSPSSSSSSSSSSLKNKRSKPVVDPPPPFSRAADLDNTAFLATLDPDKLYITHIDTHPVDWKKRIFLIPVVLNTAIVCLLAWRAWAAWPTYWALLLAALGNKNEYSVERESATWGELAGVALRRAGLFAVDYVIFVVVGSWPAMFFGLVDADGAGRGDPCAWRWRVGFREREVVVRVSRGWGAKEVLGEEGEGAGEDSMVFRQKVLPAIERRYVREKTGSLMVDANWDLDFEAMILAHGLLEKGEVKEERFEKSVWIYPGDEVGWCVWEVHRLDGEGAEAEGRQKIVAFKDRLTAMGKENLFFRWIELIQYESSQPGGFTPERQQSAVVKAKELFERQGVDFEKFVAEIGGLDGIPGLDVTGREAR